LPALCTLPYTTLFRSLAVDPEAAGLVAHEPIRLHEGAVVQQIGDALAGRLLATGVLLLHRDLISCGDRGAVALAQVLESLGGGERPRSVGHGASCCGRWAAICSGGWTPGYYATHVPRRGPVPSPRAPPRADDRGTTGADAAGRRGV